jgi:hypothetical protein
MFVEIVFADGFRAGLKHILDYVLLYRNKIKDVATYY